MSEISDPGQINFVCKRLKYVNFALSYLTKQTFKQFTHIFPHAQDLILTQCRYLTGDYTKSLIGLSRITRLEASLLSNVPPSMEEMEVLLQSLPNIVTLHDFPLPSSEALLLLLKYCPKISDISTKFVVKIVFCFMKGRKSCGRKYGPIFAEVLHPNEY